MLEDASFWGSSTLELVMMISSTLDRLGFLGCSSVGLGEEYRCMEEKSFLKAEDREEVGNSMILEGEEDATSLILEGEVPFLSFVLKTLFLVEDDGVLLLGDVSNFVRSVSLLVLLESSF